MGCRLRRDDRGATAAEYLVLVGLLAVAGVAAFGVFGGAVEGAFLGGEDGGAPQARRGSPDDVVGGATGALGDPRTGDTTLTANAGSTFDPFENVSREDLDGAVDALGATGEVDEATAGVGGEVDSLDEARLVLERYGALTDTALGEGGADGFAGVEDLMAIAEHESLPSELRRATLIVLEQDPPEKPCRGFSLCHLRGVGDWLSDRWSDLNDLRDELQDFVGDRLEDLSTIVDAALGWGVERLRDFEAWAHDLPGPLGAFVGHHASTLRWLGELTHGGVNATLDIVEGLYGLAMFLDDVARGDPDTLAAIGSFAQAAWNDPRAAWDMAFEVGRLVVQDFVGSVVGCARGDAYACGELAPDVAAAVFTGGASAALTRAGRIARFVTRHSDEAADALRVARHADGAAAARRVLDAVDDTPRVRAVHEFADHEVPHLETAAGDDVVLFRGLNSRYRPEHVFEDGMAVRQHPYNVAGSDMYASTTRSPEVAATFADSSAYVVSGETFGHVFVLRGRNARDLRVEIYDGVSPIKRNNIVLEHEWAMHEIRPDDIIGAYRVNTAPGQGFVVVGDIVPNPRYRMPGLDSARGRQVARELSEQTHDVVLRQPHSDLPSIHAQAADALPDLRSITGTTAAATGGESIFPGLKSYESILEKLGQPGREAARLTDIARTRIVYDDVDDVYAAIDYVTRNHDVVRVTDRFANPAPDGYRDIIVNVRTSNGHIAELQLHTRATHEVTETTGHVIYERIRGIEARAAREDRPLTAAERAELEDLVAQNRSAYAEAVGEAAE
jgi:Flp pilus assembly pilin Flp